MLRPRQAAYSASISQFSSQTTSDPSAPLLNITLVLVSIPPGSVGRDRFPMLIGSVVWRVQQVSDQLLVCVARSGSSPVPQLTKSGNGGDWTEVASVFPGGSRPPPPGPLYQVDSSFLSRIPHPPSLITRSSLVISIHRQFVSVFGLYDVLCTIYWKPYFCG